MYGTFDAQHTIEGYPQNDAEDVTFCITVECVSPSIPAKSYGEPSDCYPAEGAEFELDCVSVGTRGGGFVSISDAAFYAVCGYDLARSMVDATIEYAHESGEF